MPAGALIQAFVAEQAEDLRIYLAMAVKSDTSSEVYVCKPFLLDNLDGITLYPKQTVPTVNRLFIVSLNKSVHGNADPDSREQSLVPTLTLCSWRTSSHLTEGAARVAI